MKTFTQWAEDRKLELPEISENAYRTGVHAVYPSGYIRSQYPDAYFPPISATGALDIQQSKKTKDKAPPDNAP